ncbi:MAG: prepilin-type N-terminal cleavage/methylation domain-containing protein [Candidatus Pacebacteria bacterium]|nr:prepilin-type N-terminal cleavage/methylation domain-containing protein [Candidatus Paceibacterota bacterium]
MRYEKNGFTLVEVLVGSAVFLIIALAAYNAYISLFNLVNLSQYKVMAVALANEQFEIARNMPYGDVGIVNGIPKGKIPSSQTLIRGGVTFDVDAIVRNIDLPFDGQIGSTTNDTSPADNKLVQITVSCAGCENMKPFTVIGQVAPKSLETLSTNGALFVRVFDANGQPVQGASVYVENVATTTATIIINDVTDTHGMLQLIDVPPGDQAYRIIVTKDGYSTDRTYPAGDIANPTPAKPDATVIVQNVTQMSFAIDLLGSLEVSSVTPLCAVVPSFDFSLKGSKLLNSGGADVLKYSQNLITDGSGSLSLPSMEWDTYTVTPTDGSYDLAGLNPLNPVTVNPGAAQALQLILIPKDPRSLLVTVRDGATQLPISGATVELSGGASDTQVTGKGFINQTDWSGGDGQSTYSDETKYFWSNGFVDAVSTPGDLKLTNAFGSYNPDGILESSTIDTGSVSNFYSLVWSPTNASASTSVMFQIATATTSSPVSWEYLGPDGTASSYYTVSDTPISSVHNDDQYLRYKVFLHTDDSALTPIVSDVAFTFTSSCTPPGQVVFPGLSAGNYHITITKTGYATFDQDVTMGSGWQEVQAVMAP